ncbi:MAG: hypothetical protein O3B01_25415 [Planctomycetota bacterium]|nr:hypothetical protein [Planctomycetota bacterium]MDA1141917.1 hypothetical protein [Planctomycetota bacterium]
MNTCKLLLPSCMISLLCVPAFGQFSFTQPERLFLEVEDGKIEKPFKVTALADAGGNQVVTLKDKTNKKIGKVPGSEFYEGSIEFKINVKKGGEYLIWLRKRWEDGCGNSVFCTINKAMTLKDALVLGEDGTHSKLHWIRLGNKPFHLKEGVNTIRLQNREDGINLDMLAMIEFEEDVPLDEQYVPTGAEKANIKPL